MQTISFTKEENTLAWASSPIQLTGADIAVRVRLSRQGRVEVWRSISGDEYVKDGSFGSNAAGIAETNISGGVAGQYIKFRTFSEVVSAGYI